MIGRRIAWAGILSAAVFASACGGKETPQEVTAVPSTPSPPSPAPAPNGATTLAHLHIVDLAGNPLPNMVPIASGQPNAFDEPIAQGGMTSVDGKSTLAIPSDKDLFIRAWDPTKRLFANNFFEVLPGEAPQTKELDVVMVPGCAMDADLIRPDGKPLANVNVGIMMFHPTRGAWWPDEADSDGKGHVHFPCVAPGKYVIRMKTADGYQIEIAETAFPPSGKTDLGAVTLQ